MHISRQIWKYRLESRRLSDVESEILGFVRNSTETPGWLIPQIYYDFLDTKNPELLEGVFYHNRMDVLSLAALLQKIDQVLSEKEKTPNRNASETMAISVAYLNKGQYKKAAQFFSTLDF